MGSQTEQVRAYAAASQLEWPAKMDAAEEKQRRGLAVRGREGRGRGRVLFLDAL
jgi:hypothetical protein